MKVKSPPSGLYPSAPFSDYLSWDAVSRSDLEEAERSPAHFQHRRTQPSEPPTPAMVFGQALHLAILEPQRYETTVVTATINEKTGESYGRGTKAFVECEEANAGKVVLTRNERADADAIAASVRKHPTIAALSGKSRCEVSAVWTEKETGIACKARFDYLIPGVGFLDIKTCEDARHSVFQKTAQNYGYFFQLAHYADAYEAHFGKWPECYVFAIEKTTPHLCCNYVVSRDALQPAINDRRRLLIRIAKCMKDNEWPGYPEEADLYPPEWAMRRAEFEGGLQ